MHAESYAKIVREKAFKRKALEVSSNLAQNAIQDKPLSEALQQMEEFFVSSSALSGVTERMVMTAEKLCLSEMGELTWILKDWIMAGGINLSPVCRQPERVFSRWIWRLAWLLRAWHGITGR